MLWAGRFGKGPSDAVLAFTSSLPFDRRLAWYDIVGSIAHSRMLGKQGIVSRKDEKAIVSALKNVLNELESGKLDLSDGSEDVHSSIELLLTNRIGEIGAKLHTARSRNDQVATDLRMFLRDSAIEMVELLANLQAALADIARSHTTTLMPGLTHLQHAQPITLAHHMMAHLFRVERDAQRFIEAYKRINVCPLGSAALAGTTFPIDRDHVSDLLGFYRPCENAADGVSDRDFVAEYAFACALAMTHLSALCEELVLWSTPEFGFLEIDEAYSTGSSIMPQKKNPDVAELIRGRASSAIGDLASIMVLLKGMPLTYNRDLQEDKPQVFSAGDTVSSCLRMLVPMLQTARFDVGRMRERCEEGFLNATDLADYLSSKGVPFRKAHEIVGRAVRYSAESRRRLDELTLEELRGFSDRIEDDAVALLAVERCVERRDSYGGTSPKAVRRQIAEAEVSMSRQKDFVKNERARLKRVWSDLLRSGR